MNEEIIKPGLIKRVRDKLDNKRIVIGGNKELYKRKYHLQYTQQIVDNVLSALPWTLNVMLSNSKKHYNAKYNFSRSDLPYGVRYNKETSKPLSLKYRNTPEEAFADYKKHKEAYIIMMADKYMDWLPVNVYDALIDYVVEPY